MLKKFLFIFILLLIVTSVTSSGLFAAFNASIPTYHWSYDFIRELQARGYCLDLLQMHLPYSRGQVAQSLLNQKSQLTRETPNAHVQNLLKMLIREFTAEIKQLKQDDFKTDQIDFGTNIRSNYDRTGERQLNYRGVYRASVGAGFDRYFQIVSTGILDQYVYHNPTYRGVKWRGLAGYMEQAYINTNTKRFHFKFGRDFLKWGPGESGTLILSNLARPMDHFLASVKIQPFQFTFFAAQLDEAPAQRIHNSRVPVRRFLSGHRLDISFWHGRIQAAVSELMLYGGPNETFNLVYLNPFLMYHGAHKNFASPWGNILPSIDLLVHPMRNWQIYTSLLIDDIQVEKTGPIDLEPNEIGWIFGTQIADPLHLDGLSVQTEYVRITNRTYKTALPFEAFIHRNIPLGHPLGNDFDQFQISAAYWLQSNFWLKLKIAVTRHGEGSLNTPWDEPWMTYTVAEGYSEPFPTGIVESTTAIRLQTAWYIRRPVHLFGSLSFREFTNRANVMNKNESVWKANIRIELNWNQRWNLHNK